MTGPLLSILIAMAIMSIGKAKITMPITDKITSKNPFTTPQSIILIWVEEYTEHTQYKQAENN